MDIQSGSIAFVGINGNGNDTLAFLLTEDFSAGTTVNFTSSSPVVPAGTFPATGPLVTWTATSDLSAGTVVILSNLQLNAGGATASAGALNFVRPFAGTGGFTNGAPAISAYTGSEAAPTLVAHVSSQFFTQTGIDNYAKAGFVFGENAVNILPSHELGAYIGPRSGLADMRDYARLINDPANWVSQNGPTNNTADGIAPDLPFSASGFSVDPSAQSVTFSNATRVQSQAEGSGGGVTTFTFTLERMGASTAGTLDFAGVFGTALMEADDFVGGALPTTFSGSFADGETSKTISIDVAADTAYEGNEDFTLTLTSVSSGTGPANVGANAFVRAFVTNDDTVQTVSFTATSVSIVEGNSGTVDLVFTVQRSGTAGVVGDLAFSGTVILFDAEANDFVAYAPTFSGVILDGQDSATITIPVAGDIAFEGNEKFALELTSVSNPLANTEIGTGKAVGTITNDDTLVPQANYVVGTGDKFTGGITLTGTETLVIEAGAVMDVQTDTANPAVRVNGPATDVRIDNFGILKSSSEGELGGHAIRGQFGALEHTFTLVNHEGGEIYGGNVIEFSSNSIIPASPTGYPGKLIFDNAGLVYGNRAFETRQLRSSDEVIIYNRATGVLSGKDSDVVRPGNNAFDPLKVVIYNDGLIIERGNEDPAAFGADGVDFQSGTLATFYNGATGTVTASRHAITGGNSIDVYNAEGGQLIGRNGSGINLDTTVANKVTLIENRGLISGRAEAAPFQAAGVDIDGDAVDIDAIANIKNWGRIEGIGHHGYKSGEANVSEGLAIGGGSVVNYEGAEIYGFGRAIQVDNSSNAGALGVFTLTNAGRIEGAGNLPIGVAQADLDLFATRLKGGEAINILGTFADSITNGVTGQIIGGTRTGGGNDTVINAGTMTATGGSALNTGEGDDSVVNSGTITGGVLLGAGDDSWTGGGTVTGLVDGGEGIDTAVYEGPGSVHVDLADGTVAHSNGTEAVAGFENVRTGSGADVILGDTNANVIDSGAGNDQLSGAAGDDLLIGGQGADRLDGGEGVDIASYATSETGVAASLTTKRGTYGDALGDRFANVEGLAGSDFVDVLTGDGKANGLAGNGGGDLLFGKGGDDSLDGGEGDDMLDGGAGIDMLTGGAGSDLFVFAKGATGKIVAKADMILDFVSGEDLIDLSAIDANSKNGKLGNDAFAFIGTSGFSKTAGELRYELVGTDAILSGDWNGDGKADLVISLAGVSALSAGDFLL